MMILLQTEHTCSMENWWYRNKTVIRSVITGSCWLPVIILFVCRNGYSQQNLVANPGFEEKFGCPDSTGNFGNVSIGAVVSWQPKSAIQVQQMGTPDYFNQCSPIFNSLGAPTNFFGYQQPRTDSGYVGLGIKNAAYFYAREFIRVELTQPLNAGQGYCIGLYWSRAEKQDFALRGLGMVISQDSFLIDYEQYNNFTVAPVVYEDQLMEDTLNWNLLEGHFVAEGGEKWLTIGWFFDYNELNMTQMTNVNDDGGYIYIDDVFLQECDQYGIPEEEITVPDVFTPNHDGINDVFFIDPALPDHSVLYVYNRWGNLVFRSDHYQNDWDGTITTTTTATTTTTTGSPCSEGTYYYLLQLPKGTILKGTVNIFR